MKQKTSRITLKDVAEKTGLSVNTISKVVSGQAKNARISPRTVKRVQKMVEQLSYIPNQMARNLRAKRTDLIGVFVADMADSIYADIAHAILDELPKRSLFPFLTVAEAGVELCHEAWIRNRIEGLIFCGTVSGMSSEFFADLNHQGVPVVIAGNFYTSQNKPENIPSVATVHIDNYAGIQLAINHLNECGCSKVAFIAGPNWHSDAIDRNHAYQILIKEYHQPLVMYPEDSQQHWKRGYTGASLILQQQKDYDSIIAYDDITAIGAIKYLTDHGIAVPNDISVIGFDNLPQAEYSIPSLTSLEQPTETIGRKSVELLQGLLKRRSPVEHVHLMPSLVIRDSTKKPS